MLIVPIAVMLVSVGEAPVSAPAAGPPTTTLKVLARPLTGNGVDPSIARTLDEVIAGVLAKHPGFDVTTFADINALLEAQRLEDLVGCDDVSCMVEIGGAVGADRIITGSVGKIGLRYVIALQWIDAVFADPLARIDLSTREESALLDMAKRAVDQLLARARGEDVAARKRKRSPTFWTAELSAGTGFVPSIEPYQPLAQVTARLAWGGRAGGKAYYYLMGGLGGAYLQGSEERPGVGSVTYSRTQGMALLGLRAAYPMGYRNRLRAYAGAALALQWERYLARQHDGFRTSGDNLFPELRFPIGFWFRWQHRHSLIVGYRMRMVFRGDGADPLSELVRLGSSERVHFISELELGWAVHF